PPFRSVSLGASRFSGSIIYPANDMPVNQIDVHTTAGLAVLIAVYSQGERRTQIVPVGVALCVSGSIVGGPPEGKQPFGTHAYAGDATQDSITVQWVERLETLHQANLPQVGCALGSARLGQIGPFLRPGHDFPIEVKLCLLSGGKSLYGCVGTTGEGNDEA